MTNIAWLAFLVAAAVGAPARYLIDGLVQDHTDGAFPWGMFVVNVTGSLVLGTISGLGLYHGLDATTRTVVGTAGIGAYTTFSTFTFETRPSRRRRRSQRGAAKRGRQFRSRPRRRQRRPRTNRTAVTSEPDPTEPDPSEPKASRPTWRGRAFAAAYGAIVAALGYVIGRGNLFWALVVMIVIGVLFRLYAYLLIRHRGTERPPWWKWL